MAEYPDIKTDEKLSRIRAKHGGQYPSTCAYPNNDPDHQDVLYLLSLLDGPEPELRKVPVSFSGGPWDGQTYDVDRVVAPVFGAGHEIGNHYWLDVKSGNTPTYYWDGGKS